MDAWQQQPTSPTSFLMADGCPLPPYASPTSADAEAAAVDAAADDAFTVDVAAIFRRGSGDSTTSSLPLAQPQQHQVCTLMPRLLYIRCASFPVSAQGFRQTRARKLKQSSHHITLCVNLSTAGRLHTAVAADHAAAVGRRRPQHEDPPR